MKKIVCAILVLLMCGVAEVSVANTLETSTTTQTETFIFGKGKKKRGKVGKRRKNGRYKKKRGLFGRKKSGCGCPKN